VGTPGAMPVDPTVDRPHPPRPSPHVLVVGAGPAGLFAAKTLAEAGARATVVEKANQVGGLAAGTRFGDNHFEGGVHHFHALDEYIYGEISRLLGDRLIAVEKSALIRYGDRFCRYPLRFTDILATMPPWTLLRCCAGLAYQQLARAVRQREPADGEDALIQLYGGPLYRSFFRDFTQRYWGFPPKDLSAVFIDKKMPRLSAFDVVRKLLGKLAVRDRRQLGVESAIAKETLYYTERGALEIFEALRQHITKRGGEVVLGAPLEGLEVDDRRIVRARLAGHARMPIEDFRFVISTIPLPDLIGSFGKLAAQPVREAARGLYYKPLTVLGLLVKRDRVLDALYVYFRDRTFHRVGEPKSSGLKVSPPGHTILVVELTGAVKPDDHAGQAEVYERVCRELAEEGLLHSAAEVVEHHFLHRSHAYPIYLRGFEPHLECVRGFLGRFENLVSTGRQGGFAYPNMHEAMRMGHDAALRAIDYLGAP
jgi:protoporphyrinogen oxidase